MTATPRFLPGTPDTALALLLASCVCELVHCDRDRAGATRHSRVPQPGSHPLVA